MLNSGDPAGTKVAAATGLEHARLVGDRCAEGELLWIEAVARAHLGEFAEARAVAESAHDAFVSAGDDAQAASVLFVRGLIADKAGDRDEARDWMTRSADAWRVFGDERRAKWCEQAVAGLDSVA